MSTGAWQNWVKIKESLSCCIDTLGKLILKKVFIVWILLELSCIHQAWKLPNPIASLVGPFYHAQYRSDKSLLFSKCLLVFFFILFVFSYNPGDSQKKCHNRDWERVDKNIISKDMWETWDSSTAIYLMHQRQREEFGEQGGGGFIHLSTLLQLMCPMAWQLIALYAAYVSISASPLLLFELGLSRGAG